MAIMAGEAITEGGTSGMRGASKARRARKRPARKHRPNKRWEPGTGGYGREWVEEPDELYIPPGGGDGEGGSGGRGRGGGRSRARRAASAYGGQARDVGRRAQITPGRSTHQGAILAEFIVAILIITIAPIATGGSGTGVSPYAANDLKRMAAIGVVFFGLALVPGENGSKVAAWLGGLVLLGLMFFSGGTEKLIKIIDIFSPGGTQPPGSTTPPATA